MELDYLILAVLSSIGNKDSVLGVYILSAICKEHNTYRYTQRDISSRLRSLHNKNLVYKVVDEDSQFSKRYPVAYWRITEKGREYLKEINKV